MAMCKCLPVHCPLTLAACRMPLMRGVVDIPLIYIAIGSGLEVQSTICIMLQKMHPFYSNRIRYLVAFFHTNGRLAKINGCCSHILPHKGKISSDIDYLKPLINLICHEN